jgi:hypothetical protein
VRCTFSPRSGAISRATAMLDTVAHVVRLGPSRRAASPSRRDRRHLGPAHREETSRTALPHEHMFDRVVCTDTAVLHQTIDELAAGDLGSLGDTEIHELTVGLARARTRLDGTLMSALDIWDARGIWSDDGSKSPAARLSREANWSKREAGVAIRRARVRRWRCPGREALGEAGPQRRRNHRWHGAPQRAPGDGRRAGVAGRAPPPGVEVVRRASHRHPRSALHPPVGLRRTRRMVRHRPAPREPGARPEAGRSTPPTSSTTRRPPVVQATGPPPTPTIPRTTERSPPHGYAPGVDG